ncbi:MAG: hypothetical protein J5I83_02980 [Nitrosomonas communis]|nr:hypothetical protein [Nitrosomonas communis]
MNIILSMSIAIWTHNACGAIALHPASGLKRDLTIFDSGGSLCVPVTPACLNRMLDMFVSD